MLLLAISHIKSSDKSAQGSFIKMRLIFVAGVARLKICVFHDGKCVSFCPLFVVVAVVLV